MRRGREPGNVLYHVSEEPAIQRFDPRPSDYTDDPVVWAIEERRLCNYLLPRDCPRVTYYATERTTRDDVERFLGSSVAVVAIERGWVERAQSTPLYTYRMPQDSFACLDAGAGYFVSRTSVEPVAVDVVVEPLAELARRGVELRALPNLWPLRDAVVASSLQYSMIRMRNAMPR